MNEGKFDVANVTALAQRIEDCVRKVAELRKASDDARNELNHAECLLSNLRTEFTKAVWPHVDRSSLPPAPERLHA